MLPPKLLDWEAFFLQQFENCILSDVLQFAHGRSVLAQVFDKLNHFIQSVSNARKVRQTVKTQAAFTLGNFVYDLAATISDIIHFFYLLKAKKKAMIVRIMTSSITRKSFLAPEQSLFCPSWQVLFLQDQPRHREDRESEHRTCRRLQP